jgi:hypothetical protein
MIPAILYLLTSLVLFGLTTWTLYAVTQVYFAAQGNFCEHAKFIDTINLGSEEGGSWIGVQNLGDQLRILNEETTEIQTKYNQFFEVHETAVAGL